MPIGDGANFGPEGGVPIMEQVVGAAEFGGAFRTNVAKFMILVTDNREGGTDDNADAVDIAQPPSVITTVSVSWYKSNCVLVLVLI